MNAKDIISKEIIKRLIEDISKYIFDIELKSLEVLDTQLQRIEERRADIVVKVSEQGREYLLHIEIQNHNDGRMGRRMLRYWTDIALQWPEFEIRQYLIYIGKERLTMTDGIEMPGLDYHYQLVDMHRIDCEHFLQLNHPDALILAILCDFKGKDERQVIHHIVRELKGYYQDNEKAFRDAMSKLEVLSINRDLSSTVREEEQMLSVRWEELPSFEIGREKGKKEGIKEGIKKGKREGMQEGKIEGRKEEKMEMVFNAYQAGIDLETIAKITSLSISEIKNIIKL